MTELNLNPKSSEIGHFFTARFSSYNLGHGDVSSSSGNFFLQISFLVGRSLISQIVEPQKKQWLVHLYRRTRLRAAPGVREKRAIAGPAAMGQASLRHRYGSPHSTPP